MGDGGLRSSPVFIGGGRGGIGVDEVIVHGLLVLGFSIVGCPRKFLGAIGIFRIGAGAKLCKNYTVGKKVQNFNLKSSNFYFRSMNKGNVLHCHSLHYCIKMLLF